MPTAQEKLAMIRKMRDPNAGMFDLLGQIITQIQVMKGDKGDKPVKGVDYFTEEEAKVFIDFIESRIRIPKDGKDGAIGPQGPKGDRGERGPKGDSIMGPQGPKGADGKDGKNAEPIDVEKLLERAVEMLKDTQDWKDMNKKIMYNKFDQRWHGGGSSETVQIYDLTSQCDGVTKSFTVPSHTRAIKLEGTQFPIIYRPTTDWSTSGTTLTLNSGVGAPETGQTLLFYYVA